MSQKKEGSRKQRDEGIEKCKEGKTGKERRKANEAGWEKENKVIQ